MYQFTSDLLTGNQAIDKQHEQLIAAINNLLEACNKGKGRAEIESTLDFLFQYTKTHFRDEEALQLKYKYPDYASHKRYHDAFTKTVMQIADEQKKGGNTIVLVAKVNSTIASWLINHIKREDVLVAQHIKNSAKGTF